MITTTTRPPGRRSAREGENAARRGEPSRERRDDIHEPRRNGSRHFSAAPTSVKTVLTLPPTVWTALSRLKSRRDCPGSGADAARPAAGWPREAARVCE